MSFVKLSRKSPEQQYAIDQRTSPESSTSPPSTPINSTVARFTKGLKRKRVSAVTQAAGGQATDGPKKKKASRACLNCQRAHLTCNDSRPCQRCVKKGIADSCVEGHRKKAKYLLDDEELENLKRSRQNGSKDSGDHNLSSLSLNTIPNEPLVNMNFEAPFSFGSEATTMEYSMLSAILGNASDDPTLPLQSPTYPTVPQSRQSLSHQPSGYSLNGSEQWAGQPPQVAPSLPHAHQPSYTNQPPTPVDLSILPPEVNNQTSQSMNHAYPALSGPAFPTRPNNTSFLRTNSQQPSFSSGLQEASSSSAPERIEPSLSHAVVSTSQRTGGDVYQSVTRPYDYTQGYHFLMQYLQQNFEKNDILRVVRALAIFRPSLIALQMPLTEEDEIFVERCVQRSLLELEKLISFSGTPTVVWRRTGEICLAGMEFCMLTEWSRHDLLGQKRYIYEIFERQSVVEYWEKFAAHAFENATQSVYSHCVLLKPSGEPVPCAFCFSIRRDLFDLPSLVIGQWLPLLG